MTRRAGPDVEITTGAGPRRVARFKGVRDDIAARGKRFQAVAAARHKAHKDKGHSRLTGRRGQIDYNVELDDERGELAVLSMEFGTSRMRGLHILTGVPPQVAGGDSRA